MANDNFPIQKFGEGDRELLRSAVERCLGVRLTRTSGSRRKVLTDQAGNTYWLMGYGLWHGIAPDMVRDLAPDREHGLVVARRAGNKVRAFLGPLRPLLLNAGKLVVTTRGERHFDLAERGAQLYVTHIPEVVLSFLAEYDASPQEVVRSADVRKLARALSPGLREAVLHHVFAPKPGGA
jgi:hypothetical protein